MSQDPRPFQESDELLMVRVMDGDREAFDRLYERYEGRIRSFAQRFVGDRDLAADLAQEIFLKVYRNPRAFDPRGRFLTWLFAVARNACIDHLRQKRLPVAASVGTPDEDEREIDLPAPATAAPEQPLLERELKESFESLVAGLSTKLREVFVLCALQGLSYEEAAAVIGCPAKTVSSRLSRARDQFLRAFQMHLRGSDPEARA
jgi:RNA polymerase sigma-70 factor (ECF subfamily)